MRRQALAASAGAARVNKAGARSSRVEEDPPRSADLRGLDQPPRGKVGEYDSLIRPLTQVTNGTPEPPGNYTQTNSSGEDHHSTEDQAYRR